MPQLRATITLLAVTVGIALLPGCAVAAEHPVIPVNAKPEHLDSYRARIAPLLEMSEDQMLAIIPEQSGLYFVGCPNCDAGQQEGQFRGGGEYDPWTPEDPLTMRCSYCGHQYPSEQYPEDGVEEVRGPDGSVSRYPYWEDAEGYRHYFAARIDYHRIRYMEDAANWLARIYSITGEAEYARRSALIIQRFAEVCPGYVYKFDYPFRDVVFYEGDVDPADFRGGFRTSRWAWWAYMDIPIDLIVAWDNILPSGEVQRLGEQTGTDVVAEVEGFFHTTAAQVMANRDDLGNMSPGMWADLIHTGRVLEEPNYVHTAVGRLERLFTERFFYDGSWDEGAPSYHSQVVGNLGYVFSVSEGYSDPPGYEHPETGRRFDDLSIPDRFPIVSSASRWLNTMRLPNGRLVPVHDTWSTNRRSAREASEPFLLPALGHGCLGRGSGEDQMQTHLTWSPGLGHRHWDGLSLLVFAHGRELLSDLGYTHTAARAWTLATAAHNTVVVDHENQAAGAETYGTLRYFDATDSACQVVSVDNPEVYPERVETFRRTLAMVAIDDERAYVIDRFEVTGGEQHDFFLHGCADEPQALSVSGLALQPRGTLVPEDVEFVAAQNEGEAGKIVDRGYAYGYLRDLRSGVAEGGFVALDYASPEGASQLRAHLLLHEGDELVTGENPSIRNAGEDDRNLDDHMRPFAMVRSTGGVSDFVGVLEPVAGEARVTEVRPLDLPGADVALEIDLTDRTDLVLLGAASVSAQWQGHQLSAGAEMVILRAPDDGAEEMTVAAGSASWG
ncbi:MAG: heparinase, partial [Armatimonadia bacterium]|nr:heparinase [Armatimonadia bacterium]